jgi:hypothetical protein
MLSDILFHHLLTNRPPGLSPPLTAASKRHTATGRKGSTQSAIPAKRVLLPCRIGFEAKSGRRQGIHRVMGYTLTRRRCEDGLLIGAIGVGACKLAYTWEEFALAGGEFRRPLSLTR